MMSASSPAHNTIGFPLDTRTIVDQSGAEDFEKWC